MKNLEREVTKMGKKVEEIKEEEKSLAFQLIEQSQKIAKENEGSKKFLIKVFLTIIIILLLIVFGETYLFVHYINQFDFETETTEVDAGNGTTTYVEDSKTGDINYGKN